MKKVIIIFLLLALLLMIAVSMCGCSIVTEANKVNNNISKQADYFETMRRVTVYNARTDMVIFEAEGYCSISNNSHNELVITFKTGPEIYKKNYVYLNENTLYIVEDITGTITDPYHYKWIVNYNALPEVEFKP